MSNKKLPRRLERFRSKSHAQKTIEVPGKGNAVVLASKKACMAENLAKKKKSNKLVAEIESLDIPALRDKLSEVRKELMFMRFSHATSQLPNVAALSLAKKQIARILTVIRQKELGA